MPSFPATPKGADSNTLLETAITAALASSRSPLEMVQRLLELSKIVDHQFFLAKKGSVVQTLLQFLSNNNAYTSPTTLASAGAVTIDLSACCDQKELTQIRHLAAEALIHLSSHPKNRVKLRSERAFVQTVVACRDRASSSSSYSPSPSSPPPLDDDETAGTNDNNNRDPTLVAMCTRIIRNLGLDVLDSPAAAPVAVVPVFSTTSNSPALAAAPAGGGGGSASSYLQQNALAGSGKMSRPTTPRSRATTPRFVLTSSAPPQQQQQQQQQYHHHATSSDQGLDAPPPLRRLETQMPTSFQSAAPSSTAAGPAASQQQQQQQDEKKRFSTSLNDDEADYIRNYVKQLNTKGTTAAASPVLRAAAAAGGEASAVPKLNLGGINGGRDGAGHQKHDGQSQQQQQQQSHYDDAASDYSISVAATSQAHNNNRNRRRNWGTGGRSYGVNSLSLTEASTIIVRDMTSKRFRSNLRFFLAIVSVIDFVQVMMFFLLVHPPGMVKGGLTDWNRTGVAATELDHWVLPDELPDEQHPQIFFAEGVFQLLTTCTALFALFLNQCSRDEDLKPEWTWVPRNASIRNKSVDMNQVLEAIVWTVHCPIGLSSYYESARYLNGVCVFRLYSVFRSGMDFTILRTPMVRVMSNFFGLKLNTWVFFRWALNSAQSKWIVLTSVLVFFWGFLGLCFSFAEGVSIGSSIWFILCTMSTTGYGDIVPASFQGRVIGFLSMILGMVLLAYIVAQVQQLLTRPVHEGKVLDALTRSHLKGEAKRLGARIFLYRYRLNKLEKKMAAAAVVSMEKGAAGRHHHYDANSLQQQQQQLSDEEKAMRKQVAEDSKELTNIITQIQLLPSLFDPQQEMFEAMRSTIQDLREDQVQQSRMMEKLVGVIDVLQQKVEESCADDNKKRRRRCCCKCSGGDEDDKTKGKKKKKKYDSSSTRSNSSNSSSAGSSLE